MTFGKRYNLTGKEYVTRCHYVEALAEIVGAADVDLRPIPGEVMDRLWSAEIEVELATNTGMGLAVRSTGSGAPARAHSRGAQRFQLAQLVQMLAPNIHHWNHNTVFSIDRLRTDIGWEPEHTFASMAEDTYRWWVDAGLADSQEHDWSFEDNLAAALA